jgi:FixJ family two-component response regulator
VKTTPLICVVDDDASVRRALCRLLRSAGFAVATFASGEDFLAAGARESADCLILDVRLPGLSGFDVQAALAATSCRLPVVFVTAYENEKAHQQALAIGAVALFHKPFDDQALLDALRAALARGEAANGVAGGE